MWNCSAAQSVNRSTAPTVRGTIFGTPVEPEVVSMNETSSGPPGPSGPAGWTPLAVSTVQSILWVRRPTSGPGGSATSRSSHPAWSSSVEKVSEPNSTDGSKNGSRACRHAIIRAIVRGDLAA
jgi:hypothetical protein